MDRNAKPEGPDTGHVPPGMQGGGSPPFTGEDFVPPPAHVDHIRRKWLDLPYAPLSPAQQLDIYLPDTGDGPFPLVVHVHGGAFEMGDKRDDQLDPQLLGLERGYALASVNYRLSGEAVFPAGLQDVKAAVRWLRAHCAEYLLDPERVGMIGGSAGGNLTAMACVTTGLGLFDDPALGSAEQSSDVQVAVDLFGPTDFLKMDDQLRASGLGPVDHSEAGSPESRYLGRRITEIPGQVQLADPITYVHEGMPPILIQHGTLDSSVPAQQSVIFAQAIEAKVGRDRFEFELLEGAGHADPAFWTPQNMDRVYSFLDRYLK